MELENLKYVWRSLETLPAADRGTEAEIISLLHRRSKGPIATMRRNLVKEIILVLVTYTPAILVYLLDFEGRLAGISVLFLVLMTLLGIYYYRKDRLLKEMQCVSCRVKANLQLQVTTLKKYTRFYTLSGTLMIPVMAVLSFLLIRWKFPPPPGAALFYQVSKIPWWQNPLFWLSLLAPLTLGIYYVNVWYVNKLYGQHIKKLQDLLEEMEGE